jgi:anti-anti-sigma regulatory factor
MRLPFSLRFPFVRLAEADPCATPPPLAMGHVPAPGPRTARAPAEDQPRPAPRLEVEVVEVGQEAAVWLRGVAGDAESGVLETALFRLADRRPASVIFDLSELRFLSGIARGALATYCRAAVDVGVRVCRTTALQPAVREALGRVRLLDLFEVVGSAVPGVGSAPVAKETRRRDSSADAVERAWGITWSQLVDLEPLLETLLRRARVAGAHCRTIGDVHRAIVPLRDALARLVGFGGEHRGHPVLGGVGAYEVAYWQLYDAVAGQEPGHASGPGRAPGS